MFKQAADAGHCKAKEWIRAQPSRSSTPRASPSSFSQPHPALALRSTAAQTPYAPSLSPSAHKPAVFADTGSLLYSLLVTQPAFNPWARTPFVCPVTDSVSLPACKPSRVPPASTTSAPSRAVFSNDGASSAYNARTASASENGWQSHLSLWLPDVDAATRNVYAQKLVTENVRSVQQLRALSDEDFRLMGFKTGDRIVIRQNISV
jgi:hypothetical protein